MSRDLSSLESRWAFSGWLAIGAIALLSAGLYVDVSIYGQKHWPPSQC